MWVVDTGGLCWEVDGERMWLASQLSIQLMGERMCLIRNEVTEKILETRRIRKMWGERTSQVSTKAKGGVPSNSDVTIAEQFDVLYVLGNDCITRSKDERHIYMR